MHIWYIHPYGGGPGIGRMHRPFLLAREWQRAGHEATVLVSSFHHLLERPVPLSPRFEVEGVSYVALATRSYDGNGVSRILNMSDLCRRLLALAPRIGHDLKRPDAVIVSSPHPFPVYAARRIARIAGAILVFEIRDIWPLSVTEIGAASRLHPFVLAAAHAERFAYRHANLIASVLPRADVHVKAMGFAEKPFVWVPNGIGDLAAAAPVVTAAGRKALALIDAWHGEGRAVVVHAGAMGPPNGLLELVDALRGDPTGETGRRLALLLVGSGGLEDEVRRRGAEADCPVASVGAVPRSEVAGILEASDIGYAGVRNLPALYRYGVSLNKLADYMQAGLPSYLPIAPCGDVISESGAGITEAATSPEILRSALLSLARLAPEERKAMGEKGRRFMSENYAFDRIARNYLAAMERARASRTG